MLLGDRDVFVHYRRKAENHRQKIVEIVGDAGSQAPDRIHLACLPKLRFENPLFRNVLDDRDEMLGLTLCIAMNGDVYPGPHEAAVSPSILFLVDDVAIQRSRGHAAE